MLSLFELPLYSVVLIVIVFFGSGLWWAAASCNYQGGSLNAKYMLAMTTACIFVGVVAGAMGEYLQEVFQNSWVIGAFSIVFALLGLSTLGVYELPPLKFLRDKFTKTSRPEMSAPLLGGVIYIMLIGGAIKGGLALLSLGVGIGASMTLVKRSPDMLQYMEAWVNAGKAMLGVMLLACAIWVLGRILPAAVTMFLWGVFLIVLAIYLGALESGEHRLKKSAGVVLLVYGALLLTAVSAGQTDMLQSFW